MRFLYTVVAQTLAFVLSNTVSSAVIFSDDFESYTNIEDTSINWGRDIYKSNITVDTSGGYGGGTAVKFTYSGSVYSPFERYIEPENLGEVHVRFKVRFSEAPVGGIKFLKFFGKITNGNYYANFTYNFGGMSGASFLTRLCYGPGADVSNDTQCCASYGAVDCGVSPVVIDENFFPADGQWYTIDAHVKYSTDGNSDGEMWMDIDGTRNIHLAGIKNRNDLDERVVSRVSFGDYSNSSAQMTLWIDDVTISSTPISSSRRLFRNVRIGEVEP